MSAKAGPDGSLGEPCYGVDVAVDGSLTIAERVNGKPVLAERYASGDAGVAALRHHLATDRARPRICILSCSAAALSIALALGAAQRGEVMLVAPRAIELTGRSGDRAAPTSQERAERLARLAEHLY